MADCLWGKNGGLSMHQRARLGRSNRAALAAWGRDSKVERGQRSLETGEGAAEEAGTRILLRQRQQQRQRQQRQRQRQRRGRAERARRLNKPA